MLPIVSGWSLSEDHILYMLGHQSLLLKEHSVAAGLFNDLLAMTSPGLNPLQQVRHRHSLRFSLTIMTSLISRHFPAKIQS